MKEMVEFAYVFTNDKGDDEKRVFVRKNSDEGLSADTLCEAFVDFMESAGFSVDNVYDYFEE